MMTRFLSLMRWTAFLCSHLSQPKNLRHSPWSKQVEIREDKKNSGTISQVWRTTEHWALFWGFCFRNYFIGIDALPTWKSEHQMYAVLTEHKSRLWIQSCRGPRSHEVAANQTLVLHRAVRVLDHWASSLASCLFVGGFFWGGVLFFLLISSYLN